MIVPNWPARLGRFLGRFDGRLWALVASQLITSAGFSIALPFLSLYLHRDRNLSMTVVGAIMLANAVVSAAGRMAGGELADRLGRRPTVLGAAGIRLFLVLAALIRGTGPVWAIAAVYLGVRITGALAMTAISAMVADLAPGEQRMEAYGLLRVGGNVGWAAGPALGGYLAAFLPYWTLFAVTALASSVAFFLLAAFAHESHARGEREPVLGALREVLAHRRFLAFVGLSLLVFLVAGQLVSTLSVYTVERLGLSEAKFGALLTLNGLLVVFLQYPVARGVDRLRRGRALALGSLLYGVGYLAFGWLRAFPGLLGAIAVVTLGEIVFAPSTLTVTAELAPPAHRGRYMGAFGLAETMGWSAGPFLGGVLLDAFPTSPLLLWGTITAVAFLAALGFKLWGKQAWPDLAA
ncbi:MFS transporter [Candidatus Bipolaricaulota bacterium]|nr:MFS transporter [Candidatus Bipolaricaulota bacterium]